MGVVFGLFLIAGFLYLICELINESSKEKEEDLKKYWGEENYAEMKKKWQESAKREKYHGYMYTCPMCGSHEVRKLGTLNRAASISVKGLASDKIGKQYQCDHCGHKF